MGRCANARGWPPLKISGDVGLRCCAGPDNDAEVSLLVKRGQKLESRDKVDRKIAEQLLGAMPEQSQRDLRHADDFRLDRMWFWRPIGNEELIVMGGCAGLGKRPACGIVVARVVLDRAKVLAWSSSGHWLPIVQVDVDPRDLWLFGGDDQGRFRRAVRYAWGRVNLGDKERRMPKPRKKRKKRRRSR